ncbi:MAG: GDSL-type esterase/lipase family protein [Cyanobacteria bacterium P01_E01_bin.34]
MTAIQHLRSATALNPLKLVAIGDSFVYGYGDWEGGGWAERLKRHWQHPQQEGHILYNLGVRGDTVRHLEQRLETEFRQRGELRRNVPDGLILSVGANDSARLGHANGRHYVSLDEFEEAIARILTKAREFCPVWFVGMVPVDEAKMPFAGSVYYSHADQVLYNEAIREACEQYGVPFLNCFARWNSRGELWRKSRLLDDGLHPSVEGHKAVFNDLLDWPEFGQLLEKTGRVLAIA